MILLQSILFKHNLSINGNYLVFTISEDYEIDEHNKIVDFLESNIATKELSMDRVTNLRKNFIMIYMNYFQMM